MQTLLITLLAASFAAPLRAQPAGSDYATDLQSAGTVIQSRSAAMGAAMEQLTRLIAIQQAIAEIGKNTAPAAKDCSEPTALCYQRLADAGYESDAALAVINVWVRSTQDDLATRPVGALQLSELRDKVAAAWNAWFAVRVACVLFDSGAACGEPLSFRVPSTESPRRVYMGRLMALAADAGELSSLKTYSVNYCPAVEELRKQEEAINELGTFHVTVRAPCSAAQNDALRQAADLADKFGPVLQVWFEAMEDTVAGHPVTARDIAASADYTTGARAAVDAVTREDAQAGVLPGQPLGDDLFQQMWGSKDAQGGVTPGQPGAAPPAKIENGPIH